jgi:acyl-coenzyme A synthetase/AMP-(fatty) acid ligase
VDHAILQNLTLVLGPSHVAPDASLIKDVAQQEKLRAIMGVPAIYEQLLHDPEGIELLKSLDFVVCAGAPLAHAVGDRVQEHVKLYDLTGSTYVKFQYIPPLRSQLIHQQRDFPLAGATQVSRGLGIP